MISLWVKFRSIRSSFHYLLIYRTMGEPREYSTYNRMYGLLPNNRTSRQYFAFTQYGA